MQEARIELLQRMPIFGGIRTEILQFLLALCPLVSAPTGEFFFREHDEGDAMFVLEVGKAAVLKSWRGQDHLLQILNEGDCFGEMAVMDHCPRSASIQQSKIASQSVFQPPISTRCTRRTLSSLRSSR